MYDVGPLATKFHLQELERQVAAARRALGPRPAVARLRAALLRSAARVRRLLRRPRRGLAIR
jgi:hypothetical protein